MRRVIAVMFFAIIITFSMQMTNFAQESESSEEMSEAKLKDMMKELSISPISEEELNRVELDVSEYKIISSSMNIELKNIELDELNNSELLSITAYEELGLEYDVHNPITVGEAIKYQYEQQLTDEIVTYALELYPDLRSKDLKNWNQEKLFDYMKESDEAYYAPKGEMKEAFVNKDISDKDAIYLRSIFGSYENVLAETDEKLIKVLEEYYIKKIAYAKINELNKEQEEVRKSTGQLFNYSFASTLFKQDLMNYASVGDTITCKYGLTYTYYYAPKYKYDYFHPSTSYWNTTYKLQMGVVARKLYQSAFDTTSDPIATNWYGSLSDYHEAEHEGFDFIKPSSSKNIYAAGSGTVTGSTNNFGAVTVVLDNSSYSIVYGHMKNRISNGSAVDINTNVGTYSNIGANGSTSTFVDHLHLEIRYSHQTGLSDSGSKWLDSVNPINFGTEQGWLY